jgi:hypothetical protein
MLAAGALRYRAQFLQTETPPLLGEEMMPSDRFTAAAELPRREEPDNPEPERDPIRPPEREPWHDPGPPVRKVNLPPDSPSPGIPVENPDQPQR